MGAAGREAILLILHRTGGYDFASVETNPLWAQLPAVTAGRVIVADWRINTGNVFSAMECLRLFDELYSMIT